MCENYRIFHLRKMMSRQHIVNQQNFTHIYHILVAIVGSLICESLSINVSSNLP